MIKEIVKGVWAFCSYLFVPQWEASDVRSKMYDVRSKK